MWFQIILLCHAIASATAAISTANIIVGQTIALTGPMAGFSNRSSAGIRAAFQEANDAGVLQRNVTLITLDDFGDGSVALQNVKLLNSTYNAQLIAGINGNGPFEQILPFVVQNHIPLVGPMVGLSNTRSPFQDVVINLRPSFKDEMVAQARFLVEYVRLDRIACVFANDQMGVELYNTLVTILGVVGLNLVSWGSFVANGTATNMAPARDAVLRAPRQPQVVVLVGQDTQVGQFVQEWQLDPRADLNCTFMFLSVSATPTMGNALGTANWPKVFFTRTVPPVSGDYDIARRFKRVAAKYNLPTSYVLGQVCFEGYIVGRFIIEVLKGIGLGRIYNREAFLDEVYNTRIFYLDDMPVGLLGRNVAGCELSICNCSSGMRQVFVATLDASVGGVTTRDGWPVTEYPITLCEAPTNLIRRPILFGVLIPTADPVVARLAREVFDGMKQTFASINAEGGLNGRQYDVVAAEYGGDPAPVLAALMARWPLVALLGCVVAGDTSLPTALPRIGTLDLVPRPTEPGYVMDDIRTHGTTPFELLALASYVVGPLSSAVHFRVRRSPTSAALLDTLTKAVNTLQAVPASATEFDKPAAAFDGLYSGYVIGIGNATDLLAWLSLLQARPALTLLTTLPCVLQLVATSAFDANATDTLERVVFPSFSGVRSRDVEGWTPAVLMYRYGFLVSSLVSKALSQSSLTLSSTFTTPADMVNAWYDVQTVKFFGIAMGPYFATNCTGSGNVQCQCNLGVRSVAIIPVNDLGDNSYGYDITTCRVVYEPLHLPAPGSSSITLPLVLGLVLGVACVMAVVVWLVLRGQRNNWSAPKDASQPFCILFTDIQASTALWAALPNDMAQALDTHHRLIRTLIRKYRCYEVKTIGDSFMCATKSPAQALRFAFALQRTFHAHDWGTVTIDQVYDSLVVAEVKAPQCWNGLRVRVGIHFGHGDIRRDPVSKGYDYYGTVVNTAARIESVCHGGQVGVSEAVRQAVGGQVAGAVWTDLGAQPLRGLREPLRLYQVLPEGALSCRRFPPLRMERVDSREALEEEAYDFVSSPRQSSTPNVPRRRVAPSNVSTTHDKWAEVHPLVQKGEATAEELRQHYAILQTGLAALLASQVRAARQQMVRQLCERMHVVDHGAEGQQLLRTLHGLIRRVLPATIAHQAARRTSVLSKPSTATASPANRTSYVGTTHNRHSQQDNSEAQMVLADHRNESGEIGISA